MSLAEVEASRGFAPVSKPDARVLILGSLPGRLSLERSEYYAHPRNSFWRIMSHLTGVPADAAYRDRLQSVTERGGALWDVCAQATRIGSMDHKIQSKTLKLNDFGPFFELHPLIELVCFDGSKAANLYRAKVLPSLAPRRAAIKLRALPSTSPAHAALSFAQKLAIWEDGLKGFL
jgi:double-stranded uracil-DNA glycosylase